MRLLLIGHSVEDFIHLKEKDIHSPGGIIYSAIGMKNFLESCDELYLLTTVDNKSYGLFSFIYDALRKDYFQQTGNIPGVHLYIMDNAERCETYENIPESLDLSKVSDFNSFDGILINMITGNDVRLEDLINIRKTYNGLIYLDVHTLARGVDEQNRRHFRPVPDADKWISSIDILQVNENELLTLSSKKKELEIVEDILQFGLKILIITKGVLGSTVYWLDETKLNFFSQTAIKTNSINKVGCGDIYGAAFFSTYLKNGNLQEAAKIASIASGCVTCYSEIKELLNLRHDTFARFN